MAAPGTPRSASATPRRATLPPSPFSSSAHALFTPRGSALPPSPWDQAFEEASAPPIAAGASAYSLSLQRSSFMSGGATGAAAAAAAAAPLDLSLLAAWASCRQEEAAGGWACRRAEATHLLQLGVPAALTNLANFSIG